MHSIRLLKDDANRSGGRSRSRSRAKLLSDLAWLEELQAACRSFRPPQAFSSEPQSRCQQLERTDGSAFASQHNAGNGQCQLLERTDESPDAIPPLAAGNGRFQQRERIHESAEGSTPLDAGDGRYQQLEIANESADALPPPNAGDGRYQPLERTDESADALHPLHAGVGRFQQLVRCGAGASSSERSAACLAACLAACIAPVLHDAAPAAVAAQRAHLLFVSGAVTWCQACGAYGDVRLRGLLRACPGPIAGRSESGRAAALRLLRSGRHPKTQEPLPRAVPLR